MLETYIYNSVSHTIDFLYILFKLISKFHILNDRSYNHILSHFKITVIFYRITSKHSRSDINESDQFLCSGTRMC